MNRKILTVVALSALCVTTAFAADSVPTFSKDVAPLFFSKCAACHRPGEVAPMSLLTYDDARPWAKSIARAVRSGDMPPWGASAEHGTWSNDMSLSPDAVETIVRWVRTGAIEGDPSDLPAQPVFSEGWLLGEPDYIIELDEVVIPAGGDDLFPKQWVDLSDLGGEKWVKAIQFLPGDRRAAHHMLATYNSGAAGADGRGNFERGRGNGGSGVFGVWTAGMQPYVFPEGMGRLISSQTRVLLDNHYHPFGQATTDVTRIGLYFGEGELQKEVATMLVANTGLRIPPNDPNYEIAGFHVFDTDMQILAFSPHMHLRGKAMRYDVTYPDGTQETLLDVPNYNFNWQWLYYPVEPIHIPAGSRMDVTAAWDNSADNLFNPDPSAEIIYRGNTFNEMFVGFFEAIQSDGVYHQPSDQMAKLTQLLSAHPAEDSYLLGGFLPIGLYVPKSGDGWAYVVQGNGMTTMTLDDIRWDGDKLSVRTQFPTAEASAITTLIEAQLDDKGQLKGTLTYGDKAETGDEPIVMPILGKPQVAGAGEATAGGAGR